MELVSLGRSRISGLGRLAVALSLVGALGCSGERSHGVLVVFEPNALKDRITNLEISLVSTCFADEALGPEPLDPYKITELERGMAFPGMGNVDDGEYGLYVRGIGPCVAATGCVVIDIAPDGETIFEVPIREIPASRFDPSLDDNGGCQGTSVCTEDSSGGAVCNCSEGFIYDGTDCVPPPGEDEDFLSDWVWSYESTASELADGTTGARAGMAERDKSFNAFGHGDGGPLRIRGTMYDKGFGVHAPSEIRLNLDARCTRFRSLVGIDDETLGTGEAQVEVWVDEVRAFQSEMITGVSAAQEIDVDLEGAYELRLIARDLGDRIGDHVDWALARVVCEEGWRGDGVQTYTSDWSLDATSNELGPIELDQSNGSAGEGDGETITLNGDQYGKGIGVHAPSEIEIDLFGHCRRFQSDIGVDDEVTSGGSVVFQVWGDSEMLYESETLTSSSDSGEVNVDLVGLSRLRLVVTDAGDGTNGDHADWANARLLCRTGWEGEPVDTFVSDWAFIVSSNGFGPIERDATNGLGYAYDAPLIRLDGEEYPRGLGVHADSQVWLRLEGKCTRFRADVGIDDDAASGGVGSGSVTFQILAAGDPVFTSPVKSFGQAPTPINVDVTGRTQLELIAYSGGDDTGFDHADWGAARLTCEVGAQGIPTDTE